jgi:hypothetical protein
MNENPRGLLLIRDELPGFLARMESEEFQSERAFYLEAYNGTLWDGGRRVDVNVKAFQGIDSQTVLVLRNDGSLQLEQGPFV